MITFRNRENSSLFDLVIDNEKIDQCNVERQYHKERGWIVIIWVENNYIGGKILNKYKELPKNTAIVIKNWLELGSAGVNLHCGDYQRESLFNEGYFTIAFNLRKWTFSFGFEQYFVEFSRLFGLDIFKLESKIYDEDIVYIELRYSIQSKNTKFLYAEKIDLLSELVKLTELLKQYHNSAVSRLLIYHNEEIMAVFEFPEEIKISCEQYLVYFAQFLKDSGLKATSELKEADGKTLFSITPKDDVDALDKIREALAVYLNLPSSPIDYDDSFESMRLKQQVESLQYAQRMAVREIRTSEKELQLAQTIIKHQDKIIAQKDSIIEQKDKILDKISSKSIMIDSLENKEKLYEGLEFVPSEALKKYLGIIFQPISFFKQLGTNLIGKSDENLSILDSDEQTNNKESVE